MRTLTIVLTLGSLALAGCNKTPPEVMAEATEPAVTAPDTTAAVPEAVIARLAEHFNKVHFEFDSAKLTEGSMEALAANAKILQKNPTVTIEVEGHADERGTTDYNLALGDRRAVAVTKYLVEMGVAPTRVRKVSYGEEKPAIGGSDEVAWSANRRCEFRILTPQPDVMGTVAEN